MPPVASTARFAADTRAAETLIDMVKAYAALPGTQLARALRARRAKTDYRLSNEDLVSVVVHPPWCAQANGLAQLAGAQSW
jgi:hypothetical protein